MRGETYFVINQGIIEGLRTMVSELYTANFDQDVVELSAKIMPRPLAGFTWRCISY